MIRRIRITSLYSGVHDYGGNNHAEEGRAFLQTYCPAGAGDRARRFYKLAAPLGQGGRGRRFYKHAAPLGQGNGAFVSHNQSLVRTSKRPVSRSPKTLSCLS